MTFSIEQIVADIQAGEDLIAGAVKAYDTIKPALSSDDMATIQAALDAAVAQRQTDAARVRAELAEAAQH